MFLLKIPFKIPVPKIAVGIPAAIVIPTFNPRYVFAAPKTTAKIQPQTIDITVTSGIALFTGTYGI